MSYRSIAVSPSYVYRPDISYSISPVIVGALAAVKPTQLAAAAFQRAMSPDGMRRQQGAKPGRRDMLSPDLRVGSPSLARPPTTNVSQAAYANVADPGPVPVSRFEDVPGKRNGNYYAVRLPRHGRHS